MHTELQELKTAMDAGAFDTARDMATAIVTAHPDWFTEYEALTEGAESDEKAIEAVVADVEHFRAQGRLDAQYRAEAWHLHLWHGQQVGGVAGPQRRDHRLEPAVPKRREHAN